MSYEMKDYIIEDNNLIFIEKVVLSFITSCGEYNDSLEVMKDEIGIGSVSTLRRTLKSLISKGYIISENTGVNSPTTYSVVNTSDKDTFNKEDTARKFRHSGGINPKKMLEEKRKHLQGGYNRRTLLD